MTVNNNSDSAGFGFGIEREIVRVMVFHKVSKYASDQSDCGNVTISNIVVMSMLESCVCDICDI